LLSGCLLTACNTEPEIKTKDAVSVVTENVSKTMLQNSDVNYVGEVAEMQSTTVSFMNTGTISRILVSEGQRVNKGQLIAVIDSTQCYNAMLASKAMLDQAQDSYDRMKILHERQSLSEMDWVEVQSKYQQAKSSLEITKKSLADCKLLAPCSGVIGKKMLEAGMSALPAQPVCNILDISKVKVKISVPEKEISNVGIDARISVDAIGGDVFSSVAMEKGVSADAVSRTYEVRYIVENPQQKLLPGMVCNVSVQKKGDPQQNIITLPITAVQQNAGGDKYVWKISGDLAHRNIVKTGKSVGDRIEILDGISEGDIVVIKGCKKLNENSKIVTR